MNTFNIEVEDRGTKIIYEAFPKKVYKVGDHYLINYEVNGESYNALFESESKTFFNITDPENIKLLGLPVTSVVDMIFPSRIPFGRTTTIRDIKGKLPSKEYMYKRSAFLSENFNIDEHTAFGTITKLDGGVVAADYYKSSYPAYTPEGEFVWKYGIKYIGSRQYHSLNQLVKNNMGNDVVLFDGVAYSVDDYLINTKTVTVTNGTITENCMASDLSYHFNRDKLKYTLKDKRKTGDLARLPEVIDLRDLSSQGRK